MNQLHNFIYNQQKVKGQSFLGTFNIIFQYIIQDIKKKPRSFKIGIFSIFLVIGFLAAIQSAFQLSPVIFLSIAEDQVGDSDILLTPIQFENNTSINTQSDSQNILSSIRFLNSSDIEATCNSFSDHVSGCSSRWMFIGKLFDPKGVSSNTYGSYFIALNSIKERNIGLGRRLKVDVLKGNECYLTATTMRGLKLNEQEQIGLNIDLINAILINGNFFNINQLNNTNNLSPYDQIQSKIRDFIEQQINNQLAQSPQFSKNQIISFVDTLILLSNISQVDQDNIYNLFQIYLDSQGIKANSKQLLEPVIGDGNLKETSESLKEEAQKLPDDFVLNSTVLADQITPVVMRALNFTQNYTIQKAIESPNGKWAENLGNVIVVDQLDVLVYIWEGFEKELKRAQQQQQQNIGNTQTINLVNILLNSGLQNSLKQFIRSINIQEYAVLSNMVFNNRMGIYNSEDVIKKNIISISNKFYKNYGQKKAMQSTVPLSTIVIGLLILKLFLDNMIATSIFLLFMLAVLLIYSLMISDVEEKTYEFGMLRALGFQKNSLVYLLIIQGLIFAIPGLCLGLLMAYLLNSIIAFIIFDKAVMTTTYDLHWSAIALAIFLGIFIPLISVYLPIQRAMSKTLRDSLDLYHRVVNQISVSVQKLEKLGISFSQSVNAFTLILMGIVCYYIAPAAFVFKKLDLFLAIINIVLIMMIIGFTLLLNLSQKYVERVFVKLFLCIFRKEKHLEIVIVKNMNGHRRRNSKTAIMYTIALAFLIFTGAGFSLQSKQIQDNLKSSLGTDFKVQLINDKTGLDERGMREYMEEYIKRNPTHINGYSFITFSMKEFPKFKNSKLSSLSQFPSLKNLDIKGVEKNYLQSSYLDFYYPTQFDPNYKFKTISNNGNDVNDCVESLFSQEGNLNIQKSTDVFKIISNAQYRKQDQINPIPDFQVDYNSNTNKKIINKGQSEKRFTSSKYKDEEINVILPSGLKYAISLDVNTPALLEFSGIRYRTKIRCMANKFSGFKFSSYRQIQFYGESLTGIEQFKYIIDSYYYYSGHASNPEVKYFFEKVQPGSSYGIPKQSLLIKFKKNLSKFEREDLANGLRNYFKNDFTQLFDVPQIVESIEQTLFFIDLFSLVVAGISIILSFFLILVSFVSNIKENSWEFGVLRAIGLNKRQITRVYMIESCVLVLSSGFIGTVIGITVAVTLTLQFLMFTELPFVFVFPYKMFFTTFLSGFLIAVFGSYFALTEFKDKPISTIVKGLI